MSTAPQKIKRKPKVISIALSVEDQDCIDRIAKEFGLRKNTDCLRLALRETLKRAEKQSVAA